MAGALSVYLAQVGTLLTRRFLNLRRALSRFSNEDTLFLSLSIVPFLNTQYQKWCPDIRQAIRFIRFNTKAYAVAPDKLGITGSSAGGQLSLLIATAEEPSPVDTEDPLSRIPSRVQAVARFIPLTDFLNWSKPGEAVVWDKSRLALGKVRSDLKFTLRSAFEFTEWNEQAGMLVPITDVNQQLEISKQLSPLYQVTPDNPPIMIAHGDLDQAVPIQHSQNIMERLRQNKVPCKLLIRKGAGQGWPNEQV
jgi:acetyl esterase/lipase